MAGKYPVRILAISGSLRARSSNTALLHAAAALASPRATVKVFDGLDRLPHFNPDLDRDPPPLAVIEFRRTLRDADAVLISTPEYAHGLPGALKNALDWVVSSGEFMHKPVGLINASAASTFAVASLTEILTVIMARLVPAGSVTISLSRNTLTAEEIVADQMLALPLAAAVAALAASIG